MLFSRDGVAHDAKSQLHIAPRSFRVNARRNGREQNIVFLQSSRGLAAAWLDLLGLPVQGVVCNRVATCSRGGLCLHPMGFRGGMPGQSGSRAPRTMKLLRHGLLGVLVGRCCFACNLVHVMLVVVVRRVMLVVLLRGGQQTPR